MSADKSRSPVVLVVLDGWGVRDEKDHNAVASAPTPNMDALGEKYPVALLGASGRDVGLPAGYQGSSEVGHLNMGAGRIVKQELARIGDAIADGSLFESVNFQRALNNCLDNGSTMHLMGLLQDEGVHAHEDHLFAMMRYMKRKGLKDLFIHCFLDGRDTPPRSSQGYLRTLVNEMKEARIGRIGTVMGRYYSMDRGKNWVLTDRAYGALVSAVGLKSDSAESAVARSYEEDRTPDGEKMSDEYILPAIIGDYPGIKDGDSVVNFNYRQDRAIQLTRAFVEDDYAGKRSARPSITYCGLTRYYDTFRYNILDAMGEEGGMDNLLGEVISRQGLRQLRISETQKFSHVTSFFNGKRVKPGENEDRIEIKGIYDPATFAEHPAMNCHDVTERAVAEIKSGKYAFVLVNFANCDMVGHTGNFAAAVRAVGFVDGCTGAVVEATLAAGGVVLVTADHGNAEEMFDVKTGLPKTAHTTNPVEFIYVGANYREVKLRSRGILADIAPTVLNLLGIDVPAEMTAESLIES